MKQANRLRHPLKLSVLAGACLLALSQGAGAFEIDTGNPDLKVRLDTTVRYNLGIRAKDCDVNICGSDDAAMSTPAIPGVLPATPQGDLTAWQSDRKFGKAGDVMTNRIDVLPEFDFIYKERHGFRVSAAAWYDAAYSNKLPGDAGYDLFGGYLSGAGAAGTPYQPYTKRYALGPSGEFLDAFVFTGFDVGDVPVNLKLGQHNVYWGESLFSFLNGISYGQGPIDIRKAQATPGIEAKEVFKPINQLSANIDFTDRISLAGQYQFDWKPSQLPEGGTYFGAADGLSMGGGGSLLGIPFEGVAIKPAKERGDWGLALKWRPEAFDARLGFYYREYSEKFPQLVFTNLNGVPPFMFGGFGLDYSTKKAKMLGFSMGKQVGDMSVGMDLTYRTDAALAAKPFATPSSAMIPFVAPGQELPTGKVFTGVVNAINYFGKTPVYDSAVLTAEVNFSHLQSVTTGAGFFKGEGYAGCTGLLDPVTLQNATRNGCATKNAVGFAVNFEPKWFQVWDGVDVTAPMFLGMGVYGNSAVLFGDNKGQGSYSLGVAFDIQNQYTVDVKYNGFIARHSNDAAGVFSTSNAALGKYWDRDWVSLTFKTTF
ncbi:MAG TPA: DUF1302 family protein [Burkholderiaceae bacterium]|nr:DUF1302 family protein [Burkholderiaceae bacterium]